MKSFTDERHPETNDEVWILEHESVYTYGVSTDPKKIPTHLSHPALRSDRGGKITYHGPGQLVVYILMDFNRASMKPKEFIVKFQSAIHETVKSYCKDAVLNEDEDGICDDVDDCIGALDALGICNGTCASDEDADGVCDDVDDCIGQRRRFGGDGCKGRQTGDVTPRDAGHFGPAQAPER